MVAAPRAAWTEGCASHLHGEEQLFQTVLCIFPSLISIASARCAAAASRTPAACATTRGLAARSACRARCAASSCGHPT
eukprot:gene25591-biopygen12014